MKIHYNRDQEIYRFKTGERIRTTESDIHVEVDEEKLSNIVKEIMAAGEADNYELASAHLYFKKSNKRRSKHQEVHIYNW